MIARMMMIIKIASARNGHNYDRIWSTYNHLNAIDLKIRIAIRLINITSIPEK